MKWEFGVYGVQSKFYDVSMNSLSKRMFWKIIWTFLQIANSEYFALLFLQEIVQICIGIKPK